MSYYQRYTSIDDLLKSAADIIDFSEHKKKKDDREYILLSKIGDYLEKIAAKMKIDSQHADFINIYGKALKNGEGAISGIVKLFDKFPEIRDTIYDLLDQDEINILNRRSS